MRTSIRPDEVAGLGRLREEIYVCGLGVGHVLLAGELPIALELPDRKAVAPPGYCAAGGWVVALERYFGGERVVFDLDVDAYAAVHGFTDFEREHSVGVDLAGLCDLEADFLYGVEHQVRARVGRVERIRRQVLP